MKDFVTLIAIITIVVFVCLVVRYILKKIEYECAKEQFFTRYEDSAIILSFDNFKDYYFINPEQYDLDRYFTSDGWLYRIFVATCNDSRGYFVIMMETYKDYKRYLNFINEEKEYKNQRNNQKAIKKYINEIVQPQINKILEEEKQALERERLKNEAIKKRLSEEKNNYQEE